MTARSFFGALFVVLGLSIAFFHWIAHEYSLYFLWWWTDIVMHALGGLFIGIGVLWWLRFEVPRRLRSMLPKRTLLVGAVVIISAAWELFEYFFGAYHADQYLYDTTIDTLMALVGALFAYILFSRYAKQQ
jgi:hypothetical protein